LSTIVLLIGINPRQDGIDVSKLHADDYQHSDEKHVVADHPERGGDPADYLHEIQAKIMIHVVGVDRVPCDKWQASSRKCTINRVRLICRGHEVQQQRIDAPV